MELVASGNYADMRIEQRPRPHRPAAEDSRPAMAAGLISGDRADVNAEMHRQPVPASTPRSPTRSWPTGAPSLRIEELQASSGFRPGDEAQPRRGECPQGARRSRPGSGSRSAARTPATPPSPAGISTPPTPSASNAYIDAVAVRIRNAGRSMAHSRCSGPASCTELAAGPRTPLDLDDQPMPAANSTASTMARPSPSPVMSGPDGAPAWTADEAENARYGLPIEPDESARGADRSAPGSQRPRPLTSTSLSPSAPCSPGRPRPPRADGYGLLDPE